MKESNEIEISNGNTIQNSEPDEDEDDFDKRMRSVTTLPRIPKRKQLTESSTSGGMLPATEAITQKSVLERIDRSNERSYDGQHTNWPKSQKVPDSKEGKQKVSDRWPGSGDTKSRPWGDDSNESDRRRNENRAKFERFNDNKGMSNHSGASDRSEINRDKYRRPTDLARKPELTEDERWASCFAPKDLTVDDISNKCNDKSDTDGNRVSQEGQGDGNHVSSGEDSGSKSEKMTQKSSPSELKNTSGTLVSRRHDSSQLSNSTKEKRSTDASDRAKVKHHEKWDKVNSSLHRVQAESKSSVIVKNVDNTGTSKTTSTLPISTQNRQNSIVNKTPSSSTTASSPTSFFPSEDAEEFNRRQFDADWQNLFPDDASPGFASCGGTDARMPSANDYFKSSPAGSPAMIKAGASSNAPFFKCTSNLIPPTALPSDVSVQREPSPNAQPQQVATETDASTEVIDMDVSSLSSNDLELLDGSGGSPATHANNSSEQTSHGSEKATKAVGSASSRTTDEKRGNGRRSQVSSIYLYEKYTD